MKLSQYERTKFTEYIKPMYIKDKCEVCNGDYKLNLHHVDLFIQTLRQVVEDKLELDFIDDKSCYSGNQINDITAMMLGIQIQQSYLTLCEKCHKELHSKNKIKYVFDRYHKKDKKKSYKKNIYKYLVKLIGTELYKEEQKEIIKILNLRDDKDRELKSFKKIKEYINKKYKLDLVNGRVRKKKFPNGEINKNYNKRYWKVVEMNKQIIENEKEIINE